LSDSQKVKMYHDADEIKTFGNEAPIPTGRLRDLLGHIDIAPEFRIKRVSHLGWEEYIAVVEIFNGLMLSAGTWVHPSERLTKIW
jgi:hypothetical protein